MDQEKLYDTGHIEVDEILLDMNTKSERLINMHIVKGSIKKLKEEGRWVKSKGIFNQRVRKTLDAFYESNLKGVPIPLNILKEYGEQGFSNVDFEKEADFAYYDLMSHTLSKNDAYFAFQGRLAGLNPNKTNNTLSPIALKVLNLEFDTVAQLIKAGADVNQNTSHGDFNKANLLELAFDSGMSEKCDLRMVRMLLLSGVRDNPDKNLVTIQEKVLQRIEDALEGGHLVPPVGVKSPLYLNELYSTLLTFRQLGLGDDDTNARYENLIKKLSKESANIYQEADALVHETMRKFYFSEKIKNDDGLETDEMYVNEQRYNEFQYYLKNKNKLNELEQMHVLNKEQEEMLNDLKSKKIKFKQEEEQYEALLNAKKESAQKAAENNPFLNKEALDKLKNVKTTQPVFKATEPRKTFQDGKVTRDCHGFRNPKYLKEVQSIVTNLYIATEGFTNHNVIHDTSGKPSVKKLFEDLINDYPELINLPVTTLNPKKCPNEAAAHRINEGFISDTGIAVPGLKRCEPLSLSVMRSGDPHLIEFVLNSPAVDVNNINTRGESMMSILLEQENWVHLEYLFNLKEPKVDMTTLIPPANLTFIETLMNKAEEAQRFGAEDVAEKYFKAVRKFNKYMPEALRVEPPVTGLLRTSDPSAQYKAENDYYKLLENGEAFEHAKHYLEHHKEIKEYKFDIRDNFIPDVSSQNEATYFNDIIDQLVNKSKNNSVQDEKDIVAYMNALTANGKDNRDVINNLFARLFNDNPEANVDASDKIHMKKLSLRLMSETSEYMMGYVQKNLSETGTFDLSSEYFLSHLAMMGNEVLSGDLLKDYSPEQRKAIENKLIELRKEIDKRAQQQADINYENGLDKSA